MLVEGTLDDRRVEAEALRRGSNDPGLAQPDVLAGDQQLGGGVGPDDPVEVDEAKLHLARAGIRQHPECPGVSLAEVAEPEEPEPGG